MKRTKIVCTIGPASSSKPVLKEMMKAGMNVCRLNFSHGSYKDYEKMIKTIRVVARSLSQEVALLQDLQGPRIRVGELPKEGIMVKENDKVALVSERVMRMKKIKDFILIPIQYANLYRDVKPGDTILIEDGTKKMRVEHVEKEIIKCSIIVGGVIKTHKGINVPSVTLNAEVITDKDKKDLQFALKYGIDYVALSFVKDADDILKLRSLLKKIKSAQYLPHIIAKIERQEAIDNLDGIIEASDGIMVARGDLGIELPSEKVPILQKEMIGKCLSKGKPVIVATQMLDSMISSIQPTRAEVSDVSNAVIDHTDAVMLSGESATGKFPVEAVSMMSATINETEKSPYDDLDCCRLDGSGKVEAFVSKMVCSSYFDLGCKLAVIISNSGLNARTLASCRPQMPVLVFTKEVSVARKMLLYSGMYPVVNTSIKNMEGLKKAALSVAKKMGLLAKGDKMILAYGNCSKKDCLENVVICNL